MTIKSQLESLLFVAVKPLTLKDLARALDISPAVVAAQLEELEKDYQNREAGISLINNGKSYQLTTSAANAQVVETFLKSEVSGELSQPSLETLTIIAYRGPISKVEIERIRGINCSLIIRNLLLRGLIEEEFDKKKDLNYYRVSLDFIRFLGLSKLEDLPDYNSLNSSDIISRYLEEKED
ncbi:MAG: segregation and condensation protein [Patescibacteria group bacterium]|nr:segregation and condensation protein [Patescibacteria group bacterium]